MNRSLLTAGLAAFATAVSLALVGASPSTAAPDDVVLTGRVVDTSGKPLKGITVGCRVFSRSFPAIYDRTDAEGRYSFTERQFTDELEPGDGFVCDRLWFIDLTGSHASLGWPDANNINEGDSLDVNEDGSPTEADATLGPGGTLHGKVTDAKKRGLYQINVGVYDAATQEYAASAVTSPYGGYRAFGLRPGTYKILLSTYSGDGYRPVYAGGGSTFETAKTFTVRAHRDLNLGASVLPNTKPLFTSRAKPVLSYDRPLRRGTKVTVKSSGTTKPGGAFVTGTFVSRAVDPVTGVVDDSSILARSAWEYSGDIRYFAPFAGRRYVYVRTYSKKGYATTTVASSATAVAK